MLNKAKVFSNRNNNTQTITETIAEHRQKLIPERLGLIPYIFNLFYQEYHNIGFEGGKIEESKRNIAATKIKNSVKIRLIY